MNAGKGNPKMQKRNAILIYNLPNPVQMDFAVNLNALLPTPAERKNFDRKWKSFIASDDANRSIYRKRGNQLTYQSEQLIPSRTDSRPGLLLVFGNPASHSVQSGMFFAFKDNGKENRFWKGVLKKSGIFDLPFDSSLSSEALNMERKDRLLNLDYKSHFRVGLCVIISMPSAPGGEYGGVAGIQKLIGANAMKRLEDVERERVIQCSSDFLAKDGVVVSFQKNAWNTLKSDEDPPYDINRAKEGKLRGKLKDYPGIVLFGVPPTRIIGWCRDGLREVLKLIFEIRIEKHYL
jgi:hypothetical protein